MLLRRTRFAVPAFIAAIIATCLAYSPVLAMGGTVCRQHAVQGLEFQQATASALLGASTTDVNSLKLYIARVGGRLYLQSNYRSKNPDYDPSQPESENNQPYSEFPTKIAEGGDLRVLNIRAAVENIIYWGEKARDADPDVETTVRKAIGSAELYVEQDALDTHGRLPLDLTGVDRVIVVDGNSATVASAEVLPLMTPPPTLIERISGCCLYGRPPGRGQSILKALRAQTFDRAEIGVVSLFTDTGTAKTIAQAPLVKAAQERVATDGTWQEKLDTAFARSTGKTLFLVAHTEREEVVVRTPRNEVDARFSIQALVDKASAQGVKLVLIGCETSRFIDQQSLGMTVIGRYRSTEAVQRLQSALAVSKTGEDLFTNLSSQGLKLIIEGDQAKNGLLTKAKVMSPVDSARRRWVQIARLIFFKPRLV